LDRVGKKNLTGKCPEEISVSNFLKVHTLHFKTAHLRISSPLGERIKVRGIYLETTLTPTLSRQRERENHGFS
jgi:hypothetical protein